MSHTVWPEVRGESPELSSLIRAEVVESNGNYSGCLVQLCQHTAGDIQRITGSSNQSAIVLIQHIKSWLQTIIDEEGKRILAISDNRFVTWDAISEDEKCFFDLEQLQFVGNLAFPPKFVTTYFVKWPTYRKD